MKLTLQTWTLPKLATFGEFRTEAGELLARTVERDWLNNEPNVSCIPAGEYEISPRTSDRFKEHFILSAPSLAVGHDKGLRTHILIHVANWPDQVQGCIGVGEDWMVDNKGRFLGGVTNSALTMQRLREKLGTQTHSLTIKRS